MIWPIVVLTLVTLQRLSELVVAPRNTARLLAMGGHEVGANHYPLMILVHTAWLVGLWWLAPDQPINWPILGLYVALQCFRIWIMVSIGKRWTTRIIIVPGERLVARGPYRFLTHPNYVLVVAEVACLPAVFGLWLFALVFSVLNAGVLFIRIRAENEALRELRR